MHGAFHDAPRTSDAVGSGFSKRAFSSRDVDRAPSSDAPVTALRLSSRFARTSSCDAVHAGFRLREETPPPDGLWRCLRARGQDHPLTSIRENRRKY